MTTPDSAAGARTGTAGFGTAAALVGAAFAAAAVAGSLPTVGPYLLGISALIAALFLVGRATR